MIKFNELKENFNEEKLDELEITPYLKLSEKMFLLEGSEDEPGLVDIILKQDSYTNLWYIDRFSYEIHLTYTILNWYANISFEDNFTVDDYDWIQENSVYDFIVNKIEDCWKFIDILNSKLEDEIEKRNSLSAVLNNGLKMLLVKIDEFSDPEKLKMLNKEIKKIVKDNPFLIDLVKDAKIKGVM